MNSNEPTLASSARFELPDAEALILATGVIVVLLGVVALMRHRGPARGHSPVPICYKKALSLLTRRGVRRAPAMTARDFATDLRTRVPPEAADAFHMLTEAYLAERFGGETPTDDSSTLRSLRRNLPRRIRG
jgi:hypothetical protein